MTVTLTASDADSGLEGIYLDGSKVSSTSPYTFTVSQNESHTAYSLDYAGKNSGTKTINITNIDKTAPNTPSSITLSDDDWSNTDVTVTMPALAASSGAPESYVYRLDGGAWTTMPDLFTVGENGQHAIDVAVEDEAETALHISPISFILINFHPRLPK